MASSILIFIAVLFIVVLVHELGHFLMAKLFKVKVEEFGIGLPPKIVSLFKKGDTEYSLNLLPIGGFVKLYGEEFSSRIKNKTGAFFAKPAWQKILILLAGITANFLLASGLFGVYYSIKGIPVSVDNAVSVAYVEPDSPADVSGLKEGDKIELIYTDNNQTSVLPQKPKEVSQFVQSRANQRIYFKIRRPLGYQKTKVIDIPVIPAVKNDRGIVGIMVIPEEIKFYPWYLQLPLGVVQGFKDSIDWFVMIVYNLKDLVINLVVKHQAPQGVAGPVGIYQATSQVAATGMANLVRFIGLLSVNLAVINLLPLPALDGGRVVFVVLNKLWPSKKMKQVEMWVHMVGMGVLLLLMLAITFNDVARLINK